MHLFDQKILGIIILFLLGFLVVVKRMASGSVLDKPKGDLLIQLVNGFNLFFLLIVNPVAAVLLILGRTGIIFHVRMGVADPGIILVLEIAGLALYVAGYLLMVQALISLGRNYQLGGSLPRSGDNLVDIGIYHRIRHPMYTAALSISLGLALLVRTWIFFLVFGIYLTLIILLIPREEEGLQKAYGARYSVYREKVKKLIPFVY